MNRALKVSRSMAFVFAKESIPGIQQCRNQAADSRNTYTH